MKIRYMDLSVKDETLRKELLEAVEKVFIHGKIILGPEVAEFENAVADYCSVKYAVGIGSGTDALYLALRCLSIGEGDEVITSCLSFVATANAISLTGAKPVFVDIDGYYNIDADRIESAITERTRAIMPVHFAGSVCDMNKILDIARRHNLHVVEDASQAFGALWNGKMAGSFGEIACFSLNPMKVFAACGEAGVLLTNSSSIREAAIALRYNGMTDKIHAGYRSLNGRIDTIQAALLLKRLKYVCEIIKKRRRNAAVYSRLLAGYVRPPKEEENCVSAFYSYNFLCRKRDALQSFLEENGIETKINFNYLIPRQKAYSKDYGKSRFTAGDNYVSNSLSIPVHENLRDEEIEYIARKIIEFYKKTIRTNRERVVA